MSACQGSIPVPFKVCQRTSHVNYISALSVQGISRGRKHTFPVAPVTSMGSGGSVCVCVQAEELKEPPLSDGCNYTPPPFLYLHTDTISLTVNREREKENWEEKAVGLVGLSVSRHVFVLGPEASARSLLSLPPLSFFLSYPFIFLRLCVTLYLSSVPGINPRRTTSCIVLRISQGFTLPSSIAPQQTEAEETSLSLSLALSLSHRHRLRANRDSQDKHTREHTHIPSQTNHSFVV